MKITRTKTLLGEELRAELKFTTVANISEEELIYSSAINPIEITAKRIQRQLISNARFVMCGNLEAEFRELEYSIIEKHPHEKILQLLHNMMKKYEDVYNQEVEIVEARNG